MGSEAFATLGVCCGFEGFWGSSRTSPVRAFRFRVSEVQLRV